MSTKRTAGRVIQRAKGRPSVSRKEIERAVEKAKALRTDRRNGTKTAGGK